MPNECHTFDESARSKFHGCILHAPDQRKRRHVCTFAVLQQSKLAVKCLFSGMHSLGHCYCCLQMFSTISLLSSTIVFNAFVSLNKPLLTKDIAPIGVFFFATATTVAKIEEKKTLFCLSLLINNLYRSNCDHESFSKCLHLRKT